MLIDASEVADLAMSIHRNPEDFDEGDLLERISEFSTYELKELSISELDLEEWIHDEELSDKYCEKLLQGEEAPPIIFDGVCSSIIDGIHRANGYNKAGRASIPAYVGTSHSKSTS